MPKILRKSQGSISKAQFSLFAKNAYYVITTFKMLTIEFSDEYPIVRKKS